MSPDRTAKLPDAAATLDRAIADGQPVTMKELSRAVGKYDTWLQALCRDGCEEAQAIRQRMDAHNAELNSRSRWNVLLNRSRTQIFPGSTRAKKTVKRGDDNGQAMGT